MRSMRRSLLSLVVTIALLATVLLTIDLKDLFSRAAEISPAIFALVYLVLGLNLLTISFRLYRLLWHFGSPVTFKTAFKANANGLVAGLLLINIVGSILGRHMVLRRAGIDPALVALSSGYERIIIAIVSAALASIGAIYLYGPQAIEGYLHSQPVGFIVLAGIVAAFMVVATARSSFERKLLEALKQPKRALEILEISAVSLLSQGLNITSYTILVLGLQHDLDLPSIMAAAAIVGFAASLPISINGWGIREVASVFVFSSLGISTTDAITVSVTVGLLNTLLVLVLLPLTVRQNIHSASPNENAPQEYYTRAKSGLTLNSLSSLDPHKIFPLLAGLSVAILLFFQFPIEARGTVVTLNLGDPIALVALGYTLTLLIFHRALPFSLPKASKAWILMAMTALALGLIVGIARLGVTPWAIGNRGVGTLVILGYFCCGALISGQFGISGVRRLVQASLFTAMAVIGAQFLFRFGFIVGMVDLIPTFNFEGFSSNRNAFSYQLLIVLVLSSVFLLNSRFPKNTTTQLSAGIIVFGSLFTASITGYVTLFSLIMINLFFIPNIYYRRLIIPAGTALVAYLLLPYVSRAAQTFASLQGFWDIQGRPSLLAAPPLLNGSSLAERLESYVGGFHLWAKYPLLGGGVGSFIASASAEGTPLVIHSTYIWIVAEMGLAGAVLIFAIPMVKAAHFYQALRGNGSRRLVSLTMRETALLMTVVVFGVFSLTHDVAFQRIFWLFMGALLSRPIAIKF